MGNIAKLIEVVFRRDMLYVVGGGHVLYALYYYYQPAIPISDIAVIEALFILGLCYVVGYAIQDGMSLMRLVQTKPLINPSKAIKELYGKFAKYPNWEEYLDSLNELDAEEATISMHKESNETLLSLHERIVFIKQIGTTVGSCYLVIFVIIVLNVSIEILTKYFWKEPFSWWFDIPWGEILVMFAVMLLAVILLIIGKIKCLEQAIFLKKWNNMGGMVKSVNAMRSVLSFHTFEPDNCSSEEGNN